MDLLDVALEIAIDTHAGQKDRYGEPYIFHPLRMMLRFADEKSRIIAVLHDVIEDGDWNAEKLLQKGFPSDIVDAVVALSRRQDEDYESYIRRVSENPLAVPIKIADLEDNMNLTRIEQLSENDLRRVQRYHRAWQYLTHLTIQNKPNL